MDIYCDNNSQHVDTLSFMFYDNGEYVTMHCDGNGASVNKRCTAVAIANIHCAGDLGDCDILLLLFSAHYSDCSSIVYVCVCLNGRMLPLMPVADPHGGLGIGNQIH